MEVVGEAADGASAVARSLALRPDVVVMDITMGGIQGLAATGVFLVPLGLPRASVPGHASERASCDRGPNAIHASPRGHR